MEREPKAPNRTRENVIILTLTLFGGGVLLFFLDLVSMGIFTYALGVGSVIFLLGCFHYLVWGRALNAAVADERAALRQQEEEQAADEHAEGIQDLSHRRGIKRPRP